MHLQSKSSNGLHFGRSWAALLAFGPLPSSGLPGTCTATPAQVWGSLDVTNVPKKGHSLGRCSKRKAACRHGHTFGGSLQEVGADCAAGAQSSPLPALALTWHQRGDGFVFEHWAVTWGRWMWLMALPGAPCASRQPHVL